MGKGKVCSGHITNRTALSKSISFERHEVLIINSALEILSKKLQEEAELAGVSTLAPARGTSGRKPLSAQTVQRVKDKRLKRILKHKP